MTINFDDFMPASVSSTRIAARDTSADRTGAGLDRPSTGDDAECSRAAGSTRTAVQAGIFKSDTQVSYNGVTPWHTDRGTNTNVVEGTTRDRATFIRDAGLTWTPIPVELRLADIGPGMQGPKLPGRITLVRSDNGEVIAPNGVSASFPLRSPDYVVSILDDLVEAGATYETGGSLFGGRKIFASVRLNYEKEIAKGDWVSVFVLVSTGYDGQESTKVTLTSIRAVCGNTKRIAEAEGESLVKVRHTKNATLTDARDTMLARVTKIVDAEFGKYRKLAEAPMTDGQRTEFLAKLIPSSPLPTDREATIGEKAAVTRAQNVRDEIARATADQYAIESIFGTAWEELNRVTAYVDHVQGADRDAEKRYDAITWGVGADLKDRAMEILLDMMPASASA